MDQLNGKLSLTTTAPFTLQSTLKSVHVKELNCFLCQPVHFSSFPISSFVSFFLSRSFLLRLLFFFFNVVPSSAHFHLAGPDKWIRGPWQVIAVVQHVQEYVFSIKFLLCFSLPAAHSYQVYLDTKTLIGPRANKWPVVSQGDKLLVGLHVTEYWMLIGRGRGVGYNRETSVYRYYLWVTVCVVAFVWKPPLLPYTTVNNILQAEAEKLSGFTPSIIQPEAAGRGLYARCKTR